MLLHNIEGKSINHSVPLCLFIDNFENCSCRNWGTLPRPDTYAHCGNTFEWPTDGVANKLPPGENENSLGIENVFLTSTSCFSCENIYFAKQRQQAKRQGGKVGELHSVAYRFEVGAKETRN